MVTIQTLASMLKWQSENLEQFDIFAVQPQIYQTIKM